MDSLNGWPVLEPNSDRLHKWMLPGIDRHLMLREGSAGFLLSHFAMWYDTKIERLDLGQWDDWAYASRPVRGGTAPSNHASGTAVDLNATRHPHHTEPQKTFTPLQIRMIRRRVDRFFAGTIEWGGDWSPSWVDPMHFEVSASLPRCERIARRLLATPRGRALLKANPGQREVILS